MNGTYSTWIMHEKLKTANTCDKFINLSLTIDDQYPKSCLYKLSSLTSLTWFKMKPIIYSINWRWIQLVILLTELQKLASKDFYASIFCAMTLFGKGKQRNSTGLSNNRPRKCTQLTLPKSKSHKSNNHLRRMSISSPLFFISTV